MPRTEGEAEGRTNTFSSRRRTTSWNNVQKMSIYYSEIRAGHIGLNFMERQTSAHTNRHTHTHKRDRHSCVTNSICPIPPSFCSSRCRVYKYFLIWIITVCQVFIVIYSHKFPWCMQFKWLWQPSGWTRRPQRCQNWQHKAPKMESPKKKKRNQTRQSD